jgi:hypothetical protein
VKGLISFVERIKGFNEKSLGFKIEIFSWYFHQIAGKERFSPSDILPCFDLLHLPRPSNIHGQLNALCNKKPARLLRDSSGYRLSATVRGELQRYIPVREYAGLTNTMLSDLIPKITDSAQRSFLTETVICYNHGAYRAAIVMAWNLTFSHVCDKIFQHNLLEFNSQLLKILPKASVVSKRSNFEELKESKIIEIARGAGIVSATNSKILKEKLDKRNAAAHPSVAKISAVTAEEVIHDLVENILFAIEL